MMAVEFSAVVSRETTVKTYDDNAFEWFLLITVAEKFLCVAQFFNYSAFKPHIYIIFNHLVLLKTELNTKSCVLRSINKPFNKENASQFVRKVDYDA